MLLSNAAPLSRQSSLSPQPGVIPKFVSYNDGVVISKDVTTNFVILKVIALSVWLINLI